MVQAKFMRGSLASAAALLLVGASALWAQSGPGGPQPGGGGFAGGHAGLIAPDDALGFVGFEAGLAGKTVTGAPFTADFSTETTENLADGNQIDRKTTGKFARDSQGRTRRELTLPAIGSFATSNDGNGPARGVIIRDPVAGVSYILNVNLKQARELKLPPGSFQRTPVGRRGGGLQENSPNVSTQSLGTQMIGGVSAEGTRTVRTIPAGQIGNAKPIEISVERWYSPDLQTDVLIKRNDPRGGQTVFQLSNIVRGELDAALFQIPPDYTVTQGVGGGMARRGTGRQGPPPQAPTQP